MPISKSAKRHMRVSKERNLKNRARKSRIHTFELELRDKVAGKDLAGAEATMKQVEKELDKATKNNTIHKNKAARKKSRLKILVESIRG